MELWWIGNAVLLAVVIPVVLRLLHGATQPAAEIEQTADKLAAAGPILLRHLDSVSELATTQDLVRQTTAGLARYGAALDRIL
jgi:hypothetical protein